MDLSRYTLEDVLLTALKSEYEANLLYSKLAESTKNAFLKERLMFLAKEEQMLLIALPGNPVSAYICFKHYVRPMLLSIQGKGFNWPTQKALAPIDIVNKMDRTHLMRVKIISTNDDNIIEVLERQGSHMSSSIAQADGYIILAEGAVIKKGAEVEVYLF